MPKIDVFGLFIREYVYGLENEEYVCKGSGVRVWVQEEGV